MEWSLTYSHLDVHGRVVCELVNPANMPSVRHFLKVRFMLADRDRREVLRYNPIPPAKLTDGRLGSEDAVDHAIIALLVQGALWRLIADNLLNGPSGFHAERHISDYPFGEHQLAVEKRVACSCHTWPSLLK